MRKNSLVGGLLCAHVARGAVTLFLFTFLLLDHTSVAAAIGFVPLGAAIIRITCSKYVFVLCTFRGVGEGRGFNAFRVSAFLSVLLTICVIMFNGIFVGPPLTRCAGNVFVHRALFLLMIFSAMTIVYVCRLFSKILLATCCIFSFVVLFRFLAGVASVTRLGITAIFGSSRQTQMACKFDRCGTLNTFYVYCLVV